VTGLPGPADAVCTTFPSSVPDGLVTGLYLRGGLGFGEWVDGKSDVDFVVTLAQRPGPDEVAALRRAHDAVAERHPDGPFFDRPRWVVPGVARLHHLLVTGQQTTKSRAARWGATFYSERFHRVLRESLSIREGAFPPQYDDRAERGADVTAIAAYVVEEGVALR